MKVRMTLGIGFAGAEHDEIVEVEGGLSEDDLHEAWKEWAWNYIDGGPSIVEEGTEAP